MSSKFLKILFAAVLSAGLVSQSNAALLVGQILLDSAGNNWAYVGKFKVSDGPFWNDVNNCNPDADPNFDPDNSACLQGYAKALNGVQAAEEVFGLLLSGQYATSTVSSRVNRLAWYDVATQGNLLPQEADDSLLTIEIDAPNGLYDSEGDLSAYVYDRGLDKLNYVFRSASVPVPSTIALFALALFGLGARKLKR